MFKLIIPFLFNIIVFQFVSQEIIFTENFQNSNSLSNWKIINQDGFTPAPQVSEYTNAWILGVDPQNTDDTVATSTSFFTTPGYANRWLISPPIQLKSFGNFISWNARSFDPSFPESYKVLISTSGDDIANFHDTLALIIYENFEWTKNEFSLSEKGLDDKLIRVAFVLTSYDSFKLLIDDIEFRGEDPLSISENKSVFVETIYPNPFSEEVFLTSFIDELTVYNLDGKKVFNQTVFINNNVDLSFLNSGVYIFEIKKNNEIQKSKYLKN